MECQATYRFAITESRLRLRGKVRSKYEIVVIDGLNLCRVARAADYENADVDLRRVAPADPLPLTVHHSVDPEFLLAVRNVRRAVHLYGVFDLVPDVFCKFWHWQNVGHG